MNRRTFLALAAVVPVAGCLDYFGEEGDEVRDPQVEIVRSDLIRDNPGTDEESVYVWGTARYDGDRDLSLVEIEATFLDEEGEELDRIIENVREVSPEETEWEFEIEYPRFGEAAAAVEDYELEVVTGV